MRKDTARARALLEASAGLLSVPASNVQLFLLDASTAKSPAFESLNDRLSGLTQPERQQIVRALPKTNTNLFIYVTKTRLQENGVGVGRIDGQLDRRAIAAIVEKCRTLLPVRECRRGPFVPRVVETVVQMF